MLFLTRACVFYDHQPIFMFSCFNHYVMKCFEMKLKFVGLLIVGLIYSNITIAQEAGSQRKSPIKLSEQYQQMVEESESFQQYKLIPIAKINKFKAAMVDSVNILKADRVTTIVASKAVQVRNDSLQSQLAAVKSDLTETQKEVDSINFFGSLVTKTTYNVVLWGIVAVLVFLLVFLYLAFLNANRNAKQAKRDKVRLDNELEDLRRTAHDKQVKIKRELQTALNRLEDSNK